MNSGGEQLLDEYIRDLFRFRLALVFLLFTIIRIIFKSIDLKVHQRNFFILLFLA